MVLFAPRQRAVSYRAFASGSRTSLRKLGEPISVPAIGLGEAPRGDHSANQPFVEVGAWRIRRLRRGAQIIEFHPWITPDAIPTSSPAKAKAKRDPLALARHYQSLL